MNIETFWIYLLLIASLILLCAETILLCALYDLFHVCLDLFYDQEYDLPWQVFHIFEKYGYPYWPRMLCKCQVRWFRVLLSSLVFTPTFCLLLLSVTERIVLRSPVTVVWIRPFLLSVPLLFCVFWGSVRYIHIWDCYILENWPLYCIMFIFDINIATQLSFG